MNTIKVTLAAFATALCLSAVPYRAAETISSDNELLRIELEEATGAMIMERDGASGRHVALVKTPGTALRAKLRVSTAQQMYWSCSYFHRGSPARFIVLLDDQQVGRINTANVTKPQSLRSSEDWEAGMVFMSSTPLEISSGEHVVALVLDVCDERFGIELDALIFSAQNPKVPVPPLAFELETPERFRYRSKASSFATKPVQEGETIRFSFRSQAKSECALLLHYTNDGPGDLVRLTMNGQVLGTELTLDCRREQPGSGWNNRKALCFGPVNVADGINTIQIEIIESDEHGLELDELEIQPEKPL